MTDVLTDDERTKLIDAIIDRIDDHSSFHGYPANSAWLRGVIEKTVDSTIMAERDDRTIDDIFECQDVLEVFTKDPPRPQFPRWAAKTNAIYAQGGIVSNQPSALVLQTGGGGSGPYLAPQRAAVPPREPDTPERQWRFRVEQFKIHSPNWASGPHHKDGIAFYDHKKPKRRHKCWAQTWGTNTHVIYMEHCPCGAWRMDGRGRWNDVGSAPEGK